MKARVERAFLIWSRLTYWSTTTSTTARRRSVGHAKACALYSYYVSQPIGAAPMQQDEVQQQHDKGLTALIQEHFRMAGDGEVLRRTTADIHKAIEGHAPATYYAAEVYQVLHSLGYKTQLVDDTLYWLLAP